MTGGNDSGSGNGNGSKAAVRTPTKATVDPLRKRFYTTAAVEEVASKGAGPTLFRVVLDGRPVRTPARRELAVRVRALAEAIAAEWQRQQAVIDPVSMPLTRLVNSAIDGVTGRESEVRADIAKFAGSDLVCYLAEGPEDLIARQRRGWDGIRDWLAAALGARLVTVHGIMPVTQDEAALARVAAALDRYDALALAALHTMTTLTGSAALALACAYGHISPEEAWRLAHIDEDYEIEQWGEDADATERRRGRWAEMAAAGQLLSLVWPA